LSRRAASPGWTDHRAKGGGFYVLSPCETVAIGDTGDGRGVRIRRKDAAGAWHDGAAGFASLEAARRSLLPSIRVGYRGVAGAQRDD
jgi:hypothetical protein